MRKTTFLFGLVCLLLCLTQVQETFAQKFGERYQAPKRMKQGKFGTYISGNFLAAPIQGDWVFMPGFEAGVVYRRRFIVGGSFYHSVNDFRHKAETRDGIYYNMQFGGGKIEYVINPRSTFQFSVPLFVGAGQIKMVNKGDLVIDKRQYDNFVLLMPGAKVEMKVLPQLAVGLEANYRYFDRVVWEEAQFLDNKVSRPSLNLNVKYQIR